VEGRDGEEGASPKMKNLMKAPRRRTMESWPRRKPWLKERLGCVSTEEIWWVWRGRGTYDDWGCGWGRVGGGDTSCVMLDD